MGQEEVMPGFERCQDWAWMEWQWGGSDQSEQNQRGARVGSGLGRAEPDLVPLRSVLKFLEGVRSES